MGGAPGDPKISKFQKKFLKNFVKLTKFSIILKFQRHLIVILTYYHYFIEIFKILLKSLFITNFAYIIRCSITHLEFYNKLQLAFNLKTKENKYSCMAWPQVVREAAPPPTHTRAEANF